MAQRARIVSRHLLASESCAGAHGATASSESPTGRTYPAGTAETLKGNMEPVLAETHGPLELVYGSVPDDLDGRFIRNGPNPYLDRFGKKGYHEFSGDAMLHAVDFKAGKGSYMNRWVQTKRLALDKAKGEVSKTRDYVHEDGSTMGAANTAVVYHAGRLMAVFETDRPYGLQPRTLETEGYITFDGQLKRNMTAHPKVCPKTGELIYFGYQLSTPSFDYGVIDCEGKVVTQFEVLTRSGKSAMIHDMVITENYSIIFEFPLFLDYQVAMSRKSNMPFIHDTSAPTWIAVIPRRCKSADEIKWFQCDSAYCFHFANAWEGDGNIKVIGCQSDFFSFQYEERNHFRLYEWNLHMETGSVAERKLSDADVDFPIIHPRKTGSSNRYVWAATFSGGNPPFASINGAWKFDLLTGTSSVHPLLGQRWGGEFAFAPRIGGDNAEDDGYLITYTYNEEDKTSEVYILDARTMASDPVAIFRTPQRVPFGFHGAWFSRQQVEGRTS